jgi:hypothetical protein
MSRWTSGTKKQEWLKVIVRCKYKRMIWGKSFIWLLSCVSCFYMQVTQEMGGHVLHHKNVTWWNAAGRNL